ncbi:MAG TPA: flagellar filament capping protein FliD [Blastocatellia bacterium]|nr:flagellar filament capping protein FliD [Blastocatellia bacterium]
MAGVSLSGSNIDFSQLTDAIVADRSRPLTQLQSKSSEYTKRNDALKQFNSKLAALTSAANTLTNRDLGTGRFALSSATSVATVSNTDAASTGTINLNVSRLATNLTQASRTYAATTTPVLAGGATTATFELRKGGATTGTPITIDSNNNTLAGLRDAINGANTGITASIVDTDGTGTQNKLVLNSTATGSAGRVELVETTATGTGTDLNLASLNPPGATTDFSTLDASFSINGLALTRSTNSVSDAVNGVTFNLKGSGSSSVSVTARSSDIGDKVATFVNAYNDVQDFILSQYTKDAQGRPTGVLAGDPTVRAAQQQLRDALATSSSNGGSFKALTDIGIGRDQNGKLTLDSTVLSDKLTNSFSDVQALLVGKTSSDTGIANTIYNSYNKLSDSATGNIQTAITGYQDSIKRMNQSISDQLGRLTTLRTSLNRQFAAVDSAISQLNGQGTTLTSVIDSLKPRNS